jgi:histidine ammonia-lyase
MPASVFSRSTECHNQDKVSMGTIAARDCLRVLELTEQVAAGLVLALTQAITLRQKGGGLQNGVCQAVQDFHRGVSEEFELVTEDRPLDDDLRKTIDFIQMKKWKLY